MAPPSIKYIEDLTSKECEQLTQLLCLAVDTRPSPQWFSEQQICISRLPPSLLKPEGILPRLAMSLPGHPQKAQLCKTHKALNSYLIRRLFLQVTAETTTRLQRLVDNKHLPPNLCAFVRRMQSINSLWMSQDLYRVTFQAMPSDPRFERVEGDCEACILATVGGNGGILTDLRASMLGRKKKKGKIARLLKVVDAWIDWMGKSERIIEDSDVLAKEIRACRRQMQIARRQLKRNVKEGVVDSPTKTTDHENVPEDEETLLGDDPFEDRKEMDEHDDHDAENQIIDHYAQSIFSGLDSDNHRDYTQMDIHPAFRDSLQPSRGFTAQKSSTSRSTTVYAETFASQNNNPYLSTVPKPKTAYSESIYSQPSHAATTNFKPTFGVGQRTSDEQAKAYAELLEQLAKDESDKKESGRRTRRSTRHEERDEPAGTGSRPSRRDTRWSDFR